MGCTQDPSAHESPPFEQVSHTLFKPASDLVRLGKPTRGLISTCNPDDKLQWALDFLGLVGGLADALCRRREGEQHPDFSSIMPGVDITTWPLRARLELFERLKLWSGHGHAGAAVKRGEQVDSPPMRASPLRLTLPCSPQGMFLSFLGMFLSFPLSGLAPTLAFALTR